MKGVFFCKDGCGYPVIDLQTISKIQLAFADEGYLRRRREALECESRIREEIRRLGPDAFAGIPVVVHKGLSPVLGVRL